MKGRVNGQRAARRSGGGPRRPHRREQPHVGAAVVATDGRLGHVARLLRTDDLVPQFMVVATGGIRRRYPVIATALITDVEGKTVRVRGSKDTLRRLSESIPILV